MTKGNNSSDYPVCIVIILLYWVQSKRIWLFGGYVSKDQQINPDL